MGPAYEAHFEACEARVKAWIQAGEDSEEGPWPPAPLDELCFWLRHGGELEEIPSLALLDEIKDLRCAKAAPLARGAEACARLRSALDAACLDPEAAGPGLPFELRALLEPLEAEIRALGWLQRSVGVHRGALGLVLCVSENSKPPTDRELRAVRRALSLSGAPEDFALIVVPEGYSPEVVSNIAQFPPEASARLLEPGPPPEGFAENAEAES